MFNMPLSPTWSTLKLMLQKAPQALGAMTVGGALLGIPLAIIGYYLSYAAVDKYQKDVKEKLARQKARLAGTRAKVKKKMEERKTHKAAVKGRKADDRGQMAEVGSRNAEVGRKKKVRR
jgi:membrane protein implicated in regulation of membrane protease activity